MSCSKCFIETASSFAGPTGVPLTVSRQRRFDKKEIQRRRNIALWLGEHGVETDKELTHITVDGIRYDLTHDGSGDYTVNGRGPASLRQIIYELANLQVIHNYPWETTPVYPELFNIANQQHIRTCKMNDVRSVVLEGELSQIPPELNQLNLDELNLNGTGIDNLDNIDKIAPKLKRLVVVGHNLNILPDDVVGLKKLEFLTINDGPLKHVPEIISTMPNLESIIFYKSDIEELPQSLGNLPKLKVLNVHTGKLKEFPNIQQSETIMTVSLPNNRIKELPKNWNMPELYHLNLGENRIEELPENLGRLPQLIDLFVDNNRLTSLPESLLNDPPCLRRIMANENKIEELPEKMTAPNLATLELNNNPLQLLNENIADLKHLKTLNVAKTAVKWVPAIPSLQTLYLPSDAKTASNPSQIYYG